MSLPYVQKSPQTLACRNKLLSSLEQVFLLENEVEIATYLSLPTSENKKTYYIPRSCTTLLRLPCGHIPLISEGREYALKYLSNFKTMCCFNTIYEYFVLYSSRHLASPSVQHMSCHCYLTRDMSKLHLMVSAQVYLNE